VGKIVERSTGYSKTTNPCPRNLKSTKVDKMFSTFINSSTETVGPSGRVAPNREVWRLDTPEEVVHEGRWTVDPSFFVHSTIHCSMMLGHAEKGKTLNPGARSFRAPDKCPNHKRWVTVVVTCEPRAEEKGLAPEIFGRIERGLEIEAKGFLNNQDL
jgi:hypothetical protein